MFYSGNCNFPVAKHDAKNTHFISHFMKRLCRKILYLPAQLFISISFQYMMCVSLILSPFRNDFHHKRLHHEGKTRLAHIMNYTLKFIINEHFKDRERFHFLNVDQLKKRTLLIYGHGWCPLWRVECDFQLYYSFTIKWFKQFLEFSSFPKCSNTELYITANCGIAQLRKIEIR